MDGHLQREDFGKVREMTIPALSEAAIRQQATAESFRRGQNYYRQGAVVSLVQRGNVIQAEVEGSQYMPYQVRVTFDEGGITDAICSCPNTVRI